jgi:hypothetical protein
MSDQRLTYRFGPLERRGIFGPIRAGQAATLGIGAVLAIVVLDELPTAAGALLATALFASLVVVAVAPIGRRTAEEWAPIAVSFVGRRLLGQARFRSPVPMRGMLAPTRPARGPARVKSPEPEAPSPLRGVKIIDTDYRDRAIGALSEHGGRRLTAVLACRVVAFSLLDAEAQERRLARWGLVLAGTAGGPVRRIQWVERTAPAQGDELARWLQAERDPAVPLRGTAMIESYLELIDTTTRVTQEHEILIAVQVDARLARERSGRDMPAVLIEHTERVARGLEAAEVTVLGALTGEQLARTLRTAFDPFGRAELAALEAADPQRKGLAECNAWPLGANEAWDHYGTDGAVHTTYWIGAGRGSTFRRCSWTPCSGARARYARSRSRSSRSPPSARRGRSRPRSPAIALTTACALGSGSPRPRASAKLKTQPCAEKQSLPPATLRFASPGS